MEDGSGGWPASTGRHFIRDAGTNYSKMRQTNAGLVTVMGEVSNDYPIPADVRNGVPYAFGDAVVAFVQCKKLTQTVRRHGFADRGRVLPSACCGNGVGAQVRGKNL